jgi:hypothetical protein
MCPTTVQDAACPVQLVNIRSRLIEIDATGLARAIGKITIFFGIAHQPLKVRQMPSNITDCGSMAGFCPAFHCDQVGPQL